MVALITPFRDGSVDKSALQKLVAWHLAEGTHALVPCGTTGEAPTLEPAEQKEVIAIVVTSAEGKIPVLAGAGSNSTKKAIELTKLAKEAGADGVLQVTPYYNKPTQEGLFQHFKAIAESTDLPIVLYNVPGRTGVNMEAETVFRLSQIKNIVGIKEASGNLEQVKAIIKGSDKNFALYSGDDPLNLAIYELGGGGTISVTANIAPRSVAKVWNLHATGQTGKAKEEQMGLEALNKILFIETNPIPVKTALHLMGKCAEEFRLPLCKMQPANREKLVTILKEEKLL